MQIDKGAGVLRGVAVAAMIGLGLATIGGCAQVLAQESASPEPSSPPAQSTPSLKPSVEASELEDSGYIANGGITPAVQALMDDLGVFIDDGDVGVVADVDGKPSGYASFVIRTGESAVDLYWKGPLPAQMTEIIDAHPDVDVHIHEAEWTLAELIVGRDIAVEILTSDDFAGLELETIGPKPDASGLKVALGDTTPKEVKAVKKAVAKATDIRVFVETGVHTVPAAG